MRALFVTLLAAGGLAAATPPAFAQLQAPTPRQTIMGKRGDTVWVRYAVRANSTDSVLKEIPGGFVFAKCGVGMTFKRYYVRDSATKQFKIAHVDSVDAFSCGFPPIPFGVSCDSLTSLLKFNGSFGTTQEIADAFGTCKKR